MSTLVSEDIERLLVSEAERINHPDFIGLDPVQFPRRFETLQDIEIVSLLASSIAWGNRKMICRNCEKMLLLMGHDPYCFVMDRAYEEIPDGNIHRTFFASDLRHFLRGLHRIYRKYTSLDAFAAKVLTPGQQLASWALVEAVNREFAAANDGIGNSRCLPLNMDSTALKRFNMALRWLVRRDGIVDMGVWSALTPAQLYIPLDVHVGNTARGLGLISRRSNDKRTVLELTDVLRSIRPSDPVFFDYALFGIGIENGL
ncbi:MAG: TIGR02757 family protein [Paramuribaculum sp.]|nr:TIGR02757 family protein [Paramuribaculum sp.]MDE6323553.1 TIGR02757 family protein [Paramuribaculum sp.]